MSLPILNLSLHRTHPGRFADQLRRACHEVGFFLLRHDVPPAACRRALDEARRFFERPLEERMTISYERSPAFRGYMPLGVENTEGRADGRDQIEYAAEYRRDDDPPRRLPPTRADGEEGRAIPFYHRLRATNPWPDEVQPTLRPAIAEYVDGVLGVADRLRDAMCVGLGVDPRTVDPLFGARRGRATAAADADDGEPSFWSMKLVSYPPSPGENDGADATTTPSSSSPGSLHQGVGAHCDSNFLTLICQDPHASGLQVQDVRGGWIDVGPTPPDVLVCNIGELAEVWTGGYFSATPHRVLRRPSDTTRTSLPVFYNPRMDAVVEPIDDIDKLPWERSGENQWRRERNALIRSVGENSFKSLARSHPAVFERHHGDLRILEDGRIVAR